MAVGYEIDTELNLLVLAGAGRCTGTEYLDLNQRAAADVRRRSGMLTIIDLRAITELDVSLEEMRAIVEMDRRLSADGVYGDVVRTAVVVRGRGDIVLAKLYNAMADTGGLGVEVFADVDQGIEWLGLADRREGAHAVLRGLLDSLQPSREQTR